MMRVVRLTLGLVRRVRRAQRRGVRLRRLLKCVAVDDLRVAQRSGVRAATACNEQRAGMSMSLYLLHSRVVLSRLSQTRPGLA